jgi:hypothetical protein
MRLGSLTVFIGDLEARLEAQHSPPEFQPFSTSTELVDTGRFEGLPPPHLVDEL